MAGAAIAKAKEPGMNIAVTVVDESGITKLFVRMDHAQLSAVDATGKKAITAVGFGMPTCEPWFNFSKDDPILRQGVRDCKDFMLMGGGPPAISDNQGIGAIGVSGGHCLKDQECARAALALL